MNTNDYAIYVWPAIGFTALAVAWMIADSLWRARHWKKKAEELQAQKDALGK